MSKISSQQHYSSRRYTLFVSVLLPTFNGDKTITLALESLVRQTYSNMEIIIIDDASSSATYELIENYLNSSKIRYVRNKINLGLAGSLNVGIRHARGEYIARMDDDDFALPDRIAKQVEFLEAHRDIDLLGTGVAFYDQNLKFIRNYVFPLDHASIIKTLCRSNPFAHPAVMMRRSFLERSAGYDASLRRMEDLELWGRMALQSKYANLPDILLRHRVRQNKTLSAVKSGLVIRFRNGRLLGCFWKSLVWSIQYTIVEVIRHLGYRQQAFRMPVRRDFPGPGFSD